MAVQVIAFSCVGFLVSSPFQPMLNFDFAREPATRRIYNPAVVPRSSVQQVLERLRNPISACEPSSLLSIARMWRTGFDPL